MVRLKMDSKNKLVLSSASDVQTPHTIYSVGGNRKPLSAKAWHSKNEWVFQRNSFFFIFWFSFLLFVFKFRATGILCFPNNRK